jgi:CRP-like cAMP-binding protein
MLTRNALLGGLPESTLDRFGPSLRSVELPLHLTVIKAGEPFETVYFPETAVFSEVVRLRDGSMAEVNIVGREGMAGLDGYFGSWSANLDVMTLVAGTALAMALRDLLRLTEQDAEIRHGLNLYALAIHDVRAYAAACDRLHSVQTRLVRWLLRTHDRLEVDDFQLTQDDIASLLGVARPTVTANAMRLQAAGLIAYQHGHLRILDRLGLESLACECYWNIRTQLDRLGLAPRGATREPDLASEQGADGAGIRISKTGVWIPERSSHL